MTLDKINIPRRIASVLLGKDHKDSHRMVVGLFVMGIGAAIAHVEIAHFVFEVVGFGVHGMGLVPFIEALAKLVD